MQPIGASLVPEAHLQLGHRGRLVGLGLQNGCVQLPAGVGDHLPPALALLVPVRQQHVHVGLAALDQRLLTLPSLHIPP